MRHRVIRAVARQNPKSGGADVAVIRSEGESEVVALAWLEQMEQKTLQGRSAVRY